MHSTIGKHVNGCNISLPWILVLVHSALALYVGLWGIMRSHIDWLFIAFFCAGTIGSLASLWQLVRRSFLYRIDDAGITINSALCRRVRIPWHVVSNVRVSDLGYGCLFEFKRDEIPLRVRVRKRQASQIMDLIPSEVNRTDP